jgi:hypothetical protein
MIHPTYRSLDAPVRLLGFTWRQWIALIVAAAPLIAAIHFLGVPTRPAITLCTIALGVPAALSYLSQETGYAPGRLLLDMLRWRLEPRVLGPGASTRETGLVVRSPDAGLG